MIDGWTKIDEAARAVEAALARGRGRPTLEALRARLLPAIAEARRSQEVRSAAARRRLTRGPLSRPLPPDPAGRLFAPAPEVEEWARAHLIEEAGAIWNPEHGHLDGAVIVWQWTWVPYVRQGLPKVGMAEKVGPQAVLSAWTSRRLVDHARLLGGLGPDDPDPDFLITLFAPFAEECPDIEFCATADHELLHCGVAVDAYGSPKFGRDGRPRYRIVGHPVEEFPSIVRRYGPGAAAGATAELVEAARRKPEIAPARIASVCGTCRAAA